MRMDSNNPRHIIADEGYEFIRKASGEVCGSELYLGTAYYIGGVPQYPPHEDTIDDFEEVLIPVPPTEEVVAAREKKIAELMAYDASEAVNCMYFKGRPMWFDPLTRANYLNTMQSAQRMGISHVSFLGGQIPVEQAIRMLDAINLYAMQCVAVTENHRDNIERLTTVHDVENYNFTQGYPEKIRI